MILCSENRTQNCTNNTAGNSIRVQDWKIFLQKMLLLAGVRFRINKWLVLQHRTKREITWWWRARWGCDPALCTFSHVSSVRFLDKSPWRWQLSSPRAAPPRSAGNWAPWPITCNYQLPETQILDLLVISLWRGEAGAVSRWQDLPFPLCLVHFPSISRGSPEVWATHQSRNVCLTLKVWLILGKLSIRVA